MAEVDETKIYAGKVLRAIRELKNLTCPEIANRFNISAPVIYDYEQGRSFPRSKNARAMEAALNINLDVFKRNIANSEIETGVASGTIKVNPDGSITSTGGTSGVQKMRISPMDLAEKIILESNQKREAERAAARKAESDAEVATDVAGSWLPVISDAAAAECNPGLMPLLDCVNQYSEEKAFFPSGKSTDFVIRVSGDSMLPWYPSGTLLLVRPYQDIPNGKRVVAVLDEGEIIFKIFARTRKNEIALMSINDNDGRDYLFPASGKGIRYICRVVQSIRNEDDLDSAMSATGLHHNWEKKLDKLNRK